MDTIEELDVAYEQFTKNLPELIPDGVVPVNLELLQSLGILNDDTSSPASTLTRFFHVVESPDKITLYNDQFVIWVIPDTIDGEPTTLALVAIHSGPTLHLELAFSTQGVYNTSRLVLRVLERLLADIQENEDTLTNLQHSDLVE
jgi:hypothetical protein